MKSSTSFQDILAGQMHSQDSDSDFHWENADSSTTQDLEPALLSTLLGRVPVTKSQRHFQQQKAYRPAPPKPIVPYSLPQSEQNAVEFFQHWGVALSPRFKTAELKKAFWRLAKELHPDHSGRSGAEFHELKRHHQVLMSFLQNISKS